MPLLKGRLADSALTCRARGVRELVWKTPRTRSRAGTPVANACRTELEAAAWAAAGNMSAMVMCCAMKSRNRQLLSGRGNPPKPKLQGVWPLEVY